MESALLQIRALKVKFLMPTGTVRAVDGISFDVHRGETVCLVGETGCGKTVTALSILRLVGSGGRSHLVRTEGDIVFRPNGSREQHLLSLSEEELRSIRGREIAMIYQEPMTCLNPVFSSGNQIAEVLTRHKKKTKRDALAEAEELMKLVGIPEAKLRLKSYPHQLSGGMRQRVMIAMALGCKPALLIADEPTTALDVTIQAQILSLIRKIQAELRSALLFITHDLAVVAQLADRVVVMYAGKGVEIGKVQEVFRSPLHPYSKSLLRSIPKPPKIGERPERLKPIGGTVPNLAALPCGCAFHPRCPWVEDRCRQEVPRSEELQDGRTVICWRWRDLQEGR